MALVPWAAFLIPLLLAAGAGDYDVTAGEFGGAALFTLWVVALPSLLPLAVARNGAARWTALAFMTVVSGAAGLTVALSDDAQAGLVVLVVPVLAVPVTVGVWIARALGIRRGTRRGAG
ncbi:MAG: hypothetical protein KY395_04315 [Actinobacteria bacterium]|nr:hypothetical protein [Actinomycetota bacterium]